MIKIERIGDSAMSNKMSSQDIRVGVVCAS